MNALIAASLANFIWRELSFRLCKSETGMFWMMEIFSLGFDLWASENVLLIVGISQ